jgi:flagellar M-ring protein FliF
MAAFNNFFGQLGNFFNGMTAGKKITFFLVIAMLIGGFAYIIVLGNRTDYSVLYSDLSASDASNVLERLKQQKIPYRVIAGNTLMVPTDMVGEIRLDLAGEGVPQGGVKGFEIFDKNNLGMSEYLQKLNYRRALQGELARTIGHFSEVKYARVHIVIPERPLFAEKENPPSASVVLELKEGASLNETKVKSIVNLVANSVEGMDTQHITVVTTNGDMLYTGQGDSSSQMASAVHEELRSQIELDLERKIRSILERVVGQGKAIVKASAEVEMKDLKQTKEVYDPNAVVRSEQRNTEVSVNGEMNPSGAPGVKSNVIGKDNTAAAGGTSSQLKKTGETINYEISKTVEDLVEPVREIKRLSVAVMVDGSYSTVQDAAGKTTEKYVPRSQEEMDKFKALVEKAMGFNKLRGDQVEVVNLPFKQMKVSEADQKMFVSMEKRKFWAPYIKYGIMSLLVLVALMFVVRPILKQIATAAPRDVTATTEVVPGVPQIEDQSVKEVPKLEPAEPEHKEEERIISLAKENPEQFAQGLRTWITGEEKER